MAQTRMLTIVEWLLLTVIQSSDNREYGVAIMDKVSSMTKPERVVAAGTLYPTLDRLELRGFLTHGFSEPTGERGGRSRKYYSLTKAGISAVMKTHTVADRIIQLSMVAGIASSSIGAKATSSS